jgi:hypothetical protein
VGRVAENAGEGVLGYTFELLPERFRLKRTDNVRAIGIENVILHFWSVGLRLTWTEVHKVADIEGATILLEQDGA